MVFEPKDSVIKSPNVLVQCFLERICSGLSRSLSGWLAWSLHHTEGSKERPSTFDFSIACLHFKIGHFGAVLRGSKMK